MSSFFLSADADSDLQDIYAYSLEVWGEKQAERYLRSLYDAFEKLAINLEIGRLRPELGRQVRSFPRGSHMIFYMRWQDEAAILRVLHGARDIDEAFQDFDPLAVIDRGLR